MSHDDDKKSDKMSLAELPGEPAIELVRAKAQELRKAGFFGAGDTPEQMFAIAKCALAYGLDPLQGHLLLMGRKIYVTVPGLFAKAQDLRLPPVETEYVFDKEEREKIIDAWGVPADSVICRAKIEIEGKTYTSIASASGSDCFGGRPKARRDVVGMAETRAVARLLRRVVQIKLPVADEIRGEEEVSAKSALKVEETVTEVLNDPRR